MPLEGVPLVEGEACALSSSALTRDFSHLYLHDPSIDLSELLEPVEGQVEALLKKFLAIDPAPPADGIADPMAPTEGTGDGDVIDGGALLGGSTQG